jgi:ABC-2 type transport system permease protein
MSALRKYLAFARIAAAHALEDRGDLYGRMLFLGVVLGVFSALWRAVAESGLPIAATPGTLVWYLAATEWILMSPHVAHVDIENEIRRGDVACQLVRPFSYVAAQMATGVGRLLVRAPVMAVTAWGWAFVFTGFVPAPIVWLSLLPFGVAGMLLIHALYVLTGLTAFWLSDVSPLFWIWQKLLFILGGLMLPLALYPEWMQRVAAWTPFPWLLTWPASVVFGTAAIDLRVLAAGLAGWLAVVGLAAELVFRRAARTLQVNGG